MDSIFLKGKDPLEILMSNKQTEAWEETQEELEDDSYVTGRDNKNEDSNCEREQ